MTASSCECAAAPKFAVKEFLEKYESWYEFTTDKGSLNAVVPRSALKISEDQEFERES